MKIEENEITLNSQTIVLFRLTNSSGAFIELTNYGATLVSVVVPELNKELGNIILRYDKVEDYFTDPFYIGSTIGRFANRIANARFELNGKSYLLDKNDGNNSNHGGWNGFNKKIFDYTISENQLIFTLKSKDGEGGFPGNLDFTVCYSFSENNELNIDYTIISDKETIFNPTNHAYFNLTGRKNNLPDHDLQVFADQYLEMDPEFLPTGKILPVSGTTYDFRSFRKITPMNTYFIHPDKEKKGIRLLASLKEKNSGRQVDVYSDMPGVMIYTGDYLDGIFQPGQGICMEAQFYPDSPNHSHFRSCNIPPDTTRHYQIRFQFTVSPS